MNMFTGILDGVRRQIMVRGRDWLPHGVRCHQEGCNAWREKYTGVVKKCNSCGDEEYISEEFILTKKGGKNKKD